MIQHMKCVADIQCYVYFGQAFYLFVPCLLLCHSGMMSYVMNSDCSPCDVS